MTASVGTGCRGSQICRNRAQKGKCSHYCETQDHSIELELLAQLNLRELILKVYYAPNDDVRLVEEASKIDFGLRSRAVRVRSLSLLPLFLRMRKALWRSDNQEKETAVRPPTQEQKH